MSTLPSTNTLATASEVLLAKISALPLPQQTTLHIPSSSALLGKLAALLEGGPSSLAVTADFDRTITTATSLSSHGLVEAHLGFSEEFTRQSQETTAYYYPIEADPSLTKEEKLPFMKEWYEKNHTLMVGEGITLGDVKGAVGMDIAERGLFIRDGFNEMLDLCWPSSSSASSSFYPPTSASSTIEVMVFSAGLGDVILEVLQHDYHKGSVFPTDPAENPFLSAEKFNIISNRFVLHPDTGKIEGFSEELIHMFNKDLRHLPAPALLPSRGGKRTAILVGDGLGDRTMCDHPREGTPPSSPAETPFAAVLKIGFLNFRVPEFLEQYSEAYYLLICGENGDFQVVNLVIREIREFALASAAKEEKAKAGAEHAAVTVQLELVSDTVR